MAQPTFESIEIAAAMRDAIVKITDSRIKRMRPEPRVAKVLSINRSQLTAQVSLAGDQGSMNARFGLSLIPRAEGVLVRVTGSPGNYWITEILNDAGDNAIYEPLPDIVDFHTEDLDNLNNVVLPQLQTDLDAANADLDNLNTVILPGLQADLDAANLDLAANTAAISTLNTNLATAQGQINTLNSTTIPALNASLATAQGQINTLNSTTIPGLNSSLATANANIAANTSSIGTLNTNLSTAQGQINTLNSTTIPGLNSSLATANANIAANTSSISSLNGLFPITSTSITDGAITTPKMTANTINGDRILANTLNANKIVAGSITSNEMTANTINGDRITANTLNASKIVAGSITSNEMTANTINGDRITANTLNAAKIVAGSITTDRMTANTIDGNVITANTLNASKIIAGSITTDRMTANTIDGDRVTANTLNASKIIAGSITTDRFTANTISGDVITGNTLNAAKIVAGSITTDRFTSNTISGDIISTNTLNADRIVANSITAAQIAAGAINADKLTIGAMGHNLVRNGKFIDQVAGNAAVALNWSNQSATGSNFYREVSTSAPNGVWCIAYSLNTSTGSARGVSDTFLVSPGDVLSLSGSFARSGTVGLYLRIGFWATDPGNGGVNDGDVSVDIIQNNVNTTTGQTLTIPTTYTQPETWLRSGGQVTVPAGKKYAKVIVYNYIGNNSYVVFSDIDCHKMTSDLQTSLTGQRMVMRDDGNGGVIEGYVSGGLLPATINPTTYGGNVALKLTSPTQTGWGGTSSLYLLPSTGAAGTGTVTAVGSLLISAASSSVRLGLFNTNTSTEMASWNVLTGDLLTQGNVSGSTMTVYSVPSSAAAASCVMTTGGNLQRSTSSKRYKKNIKKMPDMKEAFLGLRSVIFQSKIDEGDDWYPGFIAEEADKAGLGLWVDYNEKGQPESIAYPTMVAGLLQLIQDQEKRIRVLEGAK